MTRPGDMKFDDRRAYFPRGLCQSKAGYRFSMDSLLLSSFVRLPKKGGQGRKRGLDLGCGSGVVGLGIMLENAYTDISITGLDIQQEMVDCAKANALALGFDENLDYQMKDISSYADCDNTADFVVANPPYRCHGKGKVSTGQSRAIARFEDEADLVTFCKTATRSLRDKAPFYMVHLPERFVEVVEACRSASLEPARVRFVHSRADQPARIMLLESRKNGGCSLTVEPPLFLYEGSGDATRMTEAALAFCPFLQCNAK